MEESLYDEFGNYIGPELRSSDDEESGSESESERSENGGGRDDSDDEDSDEVRSRVLSGCSVCMCVPLQQYT